MNNSTLEVSPYSQAVGRGIGDGITRNLPINHAISPQDKTRFLLQSAAYLGVDFSRAQLLDLYIG